MRMGMGVGVVWMRYWRGGTRYWIRMSGVRSWSLGLLDWWFVVWIPELCCADAETVFESSFFWAGGCTAFSSAVADGGVGFEFHAFVSRGVVAHFWVCGCVSPGWWVE